MVMHFGSVDFDRCLSAAADLLAAKMTELGIKYMFPGTARQVEAIECYCIAKRHRATRQHLGLGASFTAYEEFARENGFALDKTLMEDIYYKQRSGHTFDRVSRWVKENVDDVLNPTDKELNGLRHQRDNVAKLVPGFRSKIDILYLHMQLAAYMSEGEDCVLHFYDDNKKRVLSPLYQFYKKNTALIPKGLTLQLHVVKKASSGRGYVINPYNKRVTSTNNCPALTEQQTRHFLLAALGASHQTVPQQQPLGNIKRYVDDRGVESAQVFAQVLHSQHELIAGGESKSPGEQWNEPRLLEGMKAAYRGHQRPRLLIGLFSGARRVVNGTGTVEALAQYLRSRVPDDQGKPSASRSTLWEFRDQLNQFQEAEGLAPASPQ